MDKSFVSEHLTGQMYLCFVGPLLGLAWGDLIVLKYPLQSKYVYKHLSVFITSEYPFVLNGKINK